MRDSDETEREKIGAQVQETWVEQHGSQSTLEVTVYLSIIHTVKPLLTDIFN